MDMDLCSYCHDPIAYVSRKCPLCAAGDEIDELTRKIAELEEQLKADQN